MKVYIIIVTYNAMKWIDRCLTSIRHSDTPVNIVVVDNSSKDETLSHIETDYPEVFIIKNDINRGFGKANNQGIEYAYSQGATHFFLLNQDAYIYEDTIGKLVEVQDKYDIALVSPVHLNGDGTVMDYNFFQKIVLAEQNIGYVSDLEIGKRKEYYQVFKTNAAAWMLSLRAIKTIGGFDPIYFHYGEDGNYCQRLKYHNEKCVFVPTSYVRHDRIRQGNMKVYKENEILMHLLYNYDDVNNKVLRITKARAKLHLWHFKLAVVSLFKFDMRGLWNVINGYFKFFKRIPQIRKSLKTDRSVGPSWLILE